MQKSKERYKLLGLVGLAIMVIALAPATAHAATGDLVGQVNFSVQCGSGIGVGIAYDGTNLWYSCTGGPSDLLRADPFTGNVTASYNIAGGLGALAYDASRNAIWAGWSDGSGTVRLIQLDALKNIINSSFAFSAPQAINFAIDDGLAFDSSNDTLYISGDVASTIFHYTTGGILLDSFPHASGSICGNSGLAIGGNLLYEGFDGCNQVIVVNKTNTAVQVFNFSTLQANDSAFRDEDLECDTNTFASQGKQVMWSKEAFTPMRALAFEIPFGTCGVGGQSAAPTGSISGEKFNDLNGNGALDLGEPGLANWTIVLTDSNGTVTTTTTDATGNYTFSNLTAGVYTVSEVLKVGWAQIAPPGGTYKINITAGQNMTSIDFGNKAIPPSATCIESVNPSGKKIPPAGYTTAPGTNPKSGQNPDGFYQLLASGPANTTVRIFVNDTGSNTTFGPFVNVTNIKYTQAPGATPSIKTIGGSNSSVQWHIIGKGDLVVFATDSNGAVSTSVSCLVPPPPK